MTLTKWNCNLQKLIPTILDSAMTVKFRFNISYSSANNYVKLYKKRHLIMFFFSCFCVHSAHCKLVIVICSSHVWAYVDNCDFFCTSQWGRRRQLWLSYMYVAIVGVHRQCICHTTSYLKLLGKNQNFIKAILF
jgi:hypothetical protein